MKSKYYCILFFICVFGNINSLKSQSFELEQVQQIWRPKIKVDFSYIPKVSSPDGNYHYGSTSSSLVYSFPIKTKLGADFNLNLSSLKLKDILKNSLQLKVSQIMGNAKINLRSVTLGEQNKEIKNLINAYAGIFGLKLTKTLKIRFYSINAGLNEDIESIPSFKLRMSGLIGNLRILGLKTNYFYGLTAVWSDGIFIPVPFLGGTFPVGDKLSLNVTLPAQCYFQYHFNFKNSILFGLGIDGFRSGMVLGGLRTNLNYANFNSFITYKSKINSSFGVKCQVGYILKQRIAIN